LSPERAIKDRTATNDRPASTPNALPSAETLLRSPFTSNDDQRKSANEQYTGDNPDNHGSIHSELPSLAQRAFFPKCVCEFL
jgi:hypothetical protein